MTRLGNFARSVRPAAAALAAVRRRQLHASYRARRERYAAAAAERRLTYDPGATTAAVRRRVAARGHTVAARRLGEVHTFAFVPNLGWHFHLLPDLRELGPVTLFDYVARGYTCEEFWSRTPAAVARRRAMHAAALEAIVAGHRERPIDWVFVYASGIELAPAFVRAIVETVGVPVVNMCLDDKQSWEGDPIDGHRAGQIDIAPEFDLSWTSARVACEWYLVENARPLYLPEGFDAAAYAPRDVPRDLGASFMGAAYGVRPRVIDYMRSHGVPVTTFGPGWRDAAWADDPATVFCRSVINLGMGGIGYSEELTNVKGRDFEIPGTGGGAYLTTFNADLAQHFTVGKEILCYSTRDEMLELARHYLARPAEAAAIGRLARERCLREHRWLHRYERVCEVLGVL